MTKLLDTTHDFSSESGVELRMESTAVIALPSGETLGAFSTSSQVQVIGTSGIIAFPSGNVRCAALTGTKWSVYPANPVLQFSQSGYSNILGSHVYPTDQEAIARWDKTWDSSGVLPWVQAGKEPEFDNGLGFGGAFFDGTDYLRKDDATEIVPGNTNVVTVGAAVRFRDNPSGTQFGVCRMLTNGGGHNIGLVITNSGIPVFQVYDDTGAANTAVYATTELQADTSYTLIGVLKSDGTRKIFIDGVDDTFNAFGPVFTSGGLVRASVDVVVGAADAVGSFPMSGYILDAGWWYRDLEAEGELSQYHTYLENRFESLNGDD